MKCRSGMLKGFVCHDLSKYKYFRKPYRSSVATYINFDFCILTRILRLTLSRNLKLFAHLHCIGGG